MATHGRSKNGYKVATDLALFCETPKTARREKDGIRMENHAVLECVQFGFELLENWFGSFSGARNQCQPQRSKRTGKPVGIVAESYRTLISMDAR